MRTRTDRFVRGEVRGREMGDMKFSTIGMIVAALIFLVAAIGVSLGSISLVALGLAVMAGSLAASWMKM